MGRTPSHTQAALIVCPQSSHQSDHPPRSDSLAAGCRRLQRSQRNRINLRHAVSITTAATRHSTGKR